MNRKAYLALTLALLLVLALAGCNQAPAGGEISPSPLETATPAPSEDPSEAPTETPSETPEASPSTAPSTAPSTGDADISGAVDASTSTEESPIPLGQWAKIARYATEDSTYHTVYVRITDVVTATEDQAAIDAAIEKNNSLGSDWDQIDTADLALPEDVELCMFTYEVYVPAEFPAPDYGMVEPTVDFSQVNIGGGGIPSADGTSVYIGLGSNTVDLVTVNEDEITYTPDNTYTFQCLYTMVKGYTDYLFEITSYPDGTEDTSADVMYYAYFGHK